MNPPGSPRRRRLRAPSFIVLVGLLAGLLPLGPSASARTPAADFGLSFDGTDDFVTMGGAPGLGAAQLTLEIWFKRTAAGVGTSTGTGGFTGTLAIPLLTKGRGEAENSNVDMNYFLGINSSTNRLIADFEENNTGLPGNTPGLNHPVEGTTAITASANALWHHAAATYDGSVWKLYLDGILETTSAPINQPPRSDSIQHAGIGTAMDSTGARAGFFGGALDEGRIWNYARSQSQLQSTMNDEVTAAPGLLGRWGMNEGTGTTTADSAGSAITGTLGNSTGTRPTWVPGAFFGNSGVMLTGSNGTAIGNQQHIKLAGPGGFATGPNPSSYTVELWFNWNGVVPTGTGLAATGGSTFPSNLSATIPLVTKGRADGETAAQDINYFLGIDVSTPAQPRLGADYEEAQTSATPPGTSPGLNHPVRGVTTITANTWHHAAATWDGSTGTWNLYLDGVLDASTVVGPNRNANTANTSPAAIGTSYVSTGLLGSSNGPGFLGGRVDEVRIWNVVRTQAQIQSTMSQEVASAANLMARYGLNAGTGTAAGDTSGNGINGTLTACTSASCTNSTMGASTAVAWGLGAPFSVNHAPTVAPVINQASPLTNDTLTVTANDADSDGDSRTLDYQWRKNGLDIVGATSPTLNLATPGNGDKGDAISVRVRAHDGFTYSAPVPSSAVTILNTTPVVDSVVIDQSAPSPTDTLSATIVSHDDDGDARTYAYQWIENTVDLAGQTAATLDLGAVGAGNGDAYAVRVTANDGGTNSAPVTSDPVTLVVGNVAPVVDSVVIDETTPSTNDLLHVTVTAHDDNLDPLTYSYQWKNNGSDIPGETGSTLDLSQAGNGNKGNQISVEVVANDGALDSALVESSAVTVGNLAPVVDSVVIDQATPDTDDILSVSVTAHDDDPGDTLTYSYQWRKGGVDIPGETDATLDLGTTGNGDKGNNIRVRVTANDGSTDSAPELSSPVTIVNSAPTVTSATITPGAPDTNDILSVNVVSSDPDNDTVTYTYQWLMNASPLAGQTGATLDLGTAGNGDKGNQISVQVTGHDGTANSAPVTSSGATVQNSAPVINSVTIDQSSPQTNDVLSVTVASTDPDNDGISYTYQWRKNGSDLAGQTASTLGLAAIGNGDKGDGISVRVTAFDGTASSTPVTSSPAVTIVNTAPTATVSLDNHSPSTSATITATATRVDDDNDTVTLTYVWKVNGTTRQTTATTALTDSFDLSLANHGDNGDTVTVTVTPNDGAVNGTPVMDSASVGNLAPVVDSVAINESSPDTNDVLTVSVTAHDDDPGDTLTYSYQWRKGGVDIAGETDATLDLGTTGNGDKGNNIRVRVTANDGSIDSGPVTSGPVTIVNSAPSVTSATIAQSSPDTDYVLSVNVVSSDLDNDTVSYTYQWIKNGTDLAGQTGATLNLGTPGNGERGDEISVRVTGHDATTSSPTSPTSPAVTILNSTPSATVSLDATSPGTADILTATATKIDRDSGDIVTLTYAWDVNGTERRTTITTALTDTFDLSTAGNGDAGDVVTVTVTPSDGTIAGTPVADSATVAGGGGNLAPIATDSKYGVSKAEARTITLHATDPEIDALTYTVVTPPNSGTIQAGTGSNRVYTPVNSFTGTVTFTFRANDGTSNSNIATVTITIAPKAKITINDGSFNPLNAGPAMCGAVRFVNKGTASHSVSDTTGGLLLFSSGPIAPNTEFDYRYSAAGNYTFQVAGQATGRVKVPMKITPASGGTGTGFSVQWACEDPMPGYAFDVQIKRGTGAFVSWQNGVTTVSAVFTPDAGTGSYKFRARLRNTAGGATSAWSAAKAITVS
jgi:concanavalin A-like lectin/glucanase superfamily protein/Big-like domain-containing protein